MTEATVEQRSLELVELERKDDLLWVTMTRAERANALSPRLIAELTSVYSTDWRAEGVRAVLLRGAGKHFSAGADLEHLENLRDAGKAENLEDSKVLRRLFASVLNQPALTIAAVRGACVAGGCGLATAHDYVVAESRARFMYSEVRIGFVAALVATFLPLRVRGRDLREILLDPTFIMADRALEIGLVNRVVSDADLDQQAEKLAAGILSRASSESIARTKALLLETIGLSLDAALDRAAEVNAAARSTADCKLGIQTFLETKRSPEWR